MVRRLRVNWTFVERRRIAVGMTRAQLTDRVGATFGQDRDDDLSLHILEQLCQILDLHPAELFMPSTVLEREVPSLPVGPDDAIVEAALAGLANVIVNPPPVSRTRLATALGWTLDRLETALARLEVRLETRGVGFDRDVLHPAEPLNGLRPRYGLLDDVQRWALDQLRVADEGLADPVLLALYRIVIVGCEYSEATVDLSAETAGELQRQKLVQCRHASRVLDPSDDVRFSLMLDDELC